MEYTAALAELDNALQPRNAPPRPFRKQSIELLTWVREMTLMQQGMTAAHLSAVDKASRQLTARALYLQLAALDGPCERP